MPGAGASSLGAPRRPQASPAGVSSRRPRASPVVPRRPQASPGAPGRPQAPWGLLECSRASPGLARPPLAPLGVPVPECPQAPRASPGAPRRLRPALGAGPGGKGRASASSAGEQQSAPRRTFRMTRLVNPYDGAANPGWPPRAAQRGPWGPSRPQEVRKTCQSGADVFSAT